MNKSNIENKKEVLNLKDQYAHMYNTILSQIKDYSINLKKIYEEKLKQLNSKEKTNTNNINLENQKKINELSEMVESLKLENENLLNEQKNNLSNISKINNEKEKLQKK